MLRIDARERVVAVWAVVGAEMGEVGGCRAVDEDGRLRNSEYAKP